jgi:tetratricopeptide (TPR) repeat protein
MKMVRLILRSGLLGPMVIATVFLSGCVQQNNPSMEPPPIVEFAETRTEKDHVAEAYRLYSSARLALAAEDYDSASEFLARAVELDPSSAHLCVSLAGVHRLRGDLRSAFSLGLECSRLHPGNPEPHAFLGDLHAMDGDEAKAVEYYLEALKLGSKDSRRLRLLSANLMAKQGRYRDALEHLEILLENDPDHNVARYFCGRVHLQLKQYRQAEACLLGALESNDNTEPVLFDLGTLYQITARQGEAAEIYERLLESNPGNTAARERIIALYVDIGEPERAEPHIERLKEMSKPGGSYRKTLGLVYLRQGRYDLAIEELEAILAENSDDDKSRHYLATAYEEIGEMDLAVSHFSLVPESSTYYFNSRVHIAFIYSELDQHERATGILQGLRDAGETRRELYLMLSSLLEQRQDFDQAEIVVHEGLVHNPRDDELLFRLGVIFDKKGDKQACIEQMELLLEVNPEHAEALNYIGYSWAEQGVRLEEAERLIEKALTIKPDSGYIVDSLGWVYFKQKRYSESLEQLERAAAMAPDDPAVAEHLGDVYVKVNQIKKAIFQFRRALELNHPDPDSIREKIKNLEKRSKG